jgi:lipopolysaccharide transport system permease protein
MGSAIFTVIFGNIAGLSTDGHPAFLFYLCGSLGWQYFGSVLGVSTNALQAHSGLFSKVHFPRFIPPICDIISALQNFIIQLLILLIAVGIFKSQVPDSNTGPTLWALLLPLLVLQSAMLGMGLGFLISSASVKYRDLGRISGLLTQFLMYGSPVIYPISEIPSSYQPFLAYNPLTFIVESYRFLLLGHSTACSWEFAIPSFCTTVIIFVFGIIAYNKTQRSYVDYV